MSAETWAAAFSEVKVSLTLTQLERPSRWIIAVLRRSSCLGVMGIRFPYIWRIFVFRIFEPLLLDGLLFTAPPLNAGGSLLDCLPWTRTRRVRGAGLAGPVLEARSFATFGRTAHVDPRTGQV